MLAKTFLNMSRWQIVILAIVVSAIGGLVAGKPQKKQRKLYTKELEQAPWAPPGWLFGPAWTFINIFLLLALQQVLKSKKPHAKQLAVLQAFIWAIFFSFGYVYFNRKSSILAAIWTIADAGLAGASFALAFKSDKKLSYYYLPLLFWTSFASTVAVYQALKNDDPVFGSQALIE